ncbi:ribonuclease P protein subunit p29-like isoform X2 [Takifugu rubripes]|uniref:ribonuclease P protein subunit p29-like isoform X2 n=1 Tax=Takifugu rubripes TaxID=31033 RepID=UPI001145B387|nr:ribonuclease P protein subunit p29-like isoform X2 [Takifugu rubripes]
MLEYSRPKKEKVKRRSKGSRMNAAQKRRMKLFTIRPEHQRYELFLPLHHLWRQYITDVCSGLKPTSSPQFLQQKLLKADLHGAVLSGSSCPPVLRYSASLTNLRYFARARGTLTSPFPSCCSGSLQMPLLCRDHGDPGPGVQARLQNHHKGKQSESDPKKKQCLFLGDGWFHLLHLRQQV